MTDRELMQQALDALETICGLKSTKLDIPTTMQALRARLAQPEPEPVACDCDSPAWCKQYKKCNRAMLGLEPYVAPPQREWQGLMEEEIKQLWKDTPQLVGVYSYTDIAREVEAKLKEKNT